jgi:hypothetical protein
MRTRRYYQTRTAVRFVFWCSVVFAGCALVAYITQIMLWFAYYMIPAL